MKELNQTEFAQKSFFLIKRQTDVNSNVELEAKLPNTVGAT
jgi:hypothetical protein